MSKRKFKIGDKVQIVLSPDVNYSKFTKPNYVNKIGIVESYSMAYNDAYTISVSGKLEYSCFESELRQINIVGQQLKFDFMYK